jgi:hypothetical protein
MAGKDNLAGSEPPQQPPMLVVSTQPSIKKLLRQLDFNSAGMAGIHAMAAAAVSTALQPRAIHVGFMHQ